MELGLFKLILILLLVFVLFGAGKLPQVMGDIGKSIRALKDGLKAADKPDTSKQVPDKDKDKNV